MPKTIKKALPKKAVAPAAKTKKLAPAKPEIKTAAKPMAKSTKKSEPKVKLAIVEKEAKKSDKKSVKLEIKATEVLAATPTEEEEEEAESASASAGAASQSGLAMAAANAETAAGSLKNFRHHPDIENFYRFIYENDLRYEALEIIDLMASQRVQIKAARAAKARTI